ncbi:ABC transporter permease [Streptomyces sp. NBC_00063]|uniref:ABC transporter permease n=1 Tax=Streptomyces sp. NBC_00063 TaxID=2975638 RepID=UPI003D7488E0
MTTADIGVITRRRFAVSRRLASLGPITAVAGAVCALLVLAAVVGPLIAPYDPLELDPSNAYSGSTGAHWLGADDLGRDNLSRLIYGARSSLLGAALIVVMSSVLGTGLALAAAWFGGVVDTLICRAIDIVFSFPGLILAVIASTVFGGGFFPPLCALAIAFTPMLARIVRSAAVRERRLPYIAALQVQGTPAWSICLRHLLPNVMPLVVVQAVIGFGYALVDLSAIAFLGLGIQPPAPDWGLMAANGQSSILGGHPEQSLYAGLTVMISVVSFNLVGERVVQHLEKEFR